MPASPPQPSSSPNRREKPRSTPPPATPTGSAPGVVPGRSSATTRSRRKPTNLPRARTCTPTFKRTSNAEWRTVTAGSPPSRTSRTPSSTRDPARSRSTGIRRLRPLGRTASCPTRSTITTAAGTHCASSATTQHCHCRNLPSGSSNASSAASRRTARNPPCGQVQGLRGPPQPAHRALLRDPQLVGRSVGCGAGIGVACEAVGQPGPQRHRVAACPRPAPHVGLRQRLRLHPLGTSARRLGGGTCRAP